MNKTKLKQTEIGEIPERWELRELGSLGRVVTGKTPPTKDVDNFGEGYPFITPRDMIGQKYIRITERYITEKGKDVVKGCFLPMDSVCVSCFRRNYVDSGVIFGSFTDFYAKHIANRAAVRRLPGESYS